MNFLKFLFVFTLIFLATFAQRFYRHSNNGTEFINGMEMGDFDNLASDGSNVQQVNDDVKLIGYGEEIKLELQNKVLKFKFCSEGCMNNNVTVCYDAKYVVTGAKGDCGANQCGFKAGISKGDTTNYIWFSKPFVLKHFEFDEDECATAIMKSPTTIMESSADRSIPFASCDPLLIDGNVVKLFVKKASKDCFLTVMNANIWTPTTPSSLTSVVPDSVVCSTNVFLQKTALFFAKARVFFASRVFDWHCFFFEKHPGFCKKTFVKQTTGKEETSNATTIWIIVGVGLFLLLIIIVGLG